MAQIKRQSYAKSSLILFEKISLLSTLEDYNSSYPIHRNPYQKMWKKTEYLYSLLSRSTLKAGLSLTSTQYFLFKLSSGEIDEVCNGSPSLHCVMKIKKKTYLDCSFVVGTGKPKLYYSRCFQQNSHLKLRHSDYDNISMWTWQTILFLYIDLQKKEIQGVSTNRNYYTKNAT